MKKSGIRIVFILVHLHISCVLKNLASNGKRSKIFNTMRCVSSGTRSSTIKYSSLRLKQKSKSSFCVFCCSLPKGSWNFQFVLCTLEILVIANVSSTIWISIYRKKCRNCHVCQCTVHMWSTKLCAHFQLTFRICESKTSSTEFQFDFKYLSQKKASCLFFALKKWLNSYIALHSANNSYVNWTNNWFGCPSYKKNPRQNENPLKNRLLFAFCQLFHMWILWIQRKKSTIFFTFTFVTSSRLHNQYRMNNKRFKVSHTWVLGLSSSAEIIGYNDILGALA